MTYYDKYIKYKYKYNILKNQLGGKGTQGTQFILHDSNTETKINTDTIIYLTDRNFNFHQNLEEVSKFSDALKISFKNGDILLQIINQNNLEEKYDLLYSNIIVYYLNNFIIKNDTNDTNKIIFIFKNKFIRRISYYDLNNNEVNLNLNLPDDKNIQIILKQSLK